MLNTVKECIIFNFLKHKINYNTIQIQYLFNWCFSFSLVLALYILYLKNTDCVFLMFLRFYFYWLLYYVELLYYHILLSSVLFYYHYLDIHTVFLFVYYIILILLWPFNLFNFTLRLMVFFILHTKHSILTTFTRVVAEHLSS